MIEGLSVTLAHYLVVSAVIFGLGTVIALSKRNAVAVLMGVELMLNAVNLTLIAFSRFSSAFAQGEEPLAARDNSNSLYVLPALAAGFGVAALIALVAVVTPWHELRGEALQANAPVTTVAVIGDLLLGRYVLPFEVASILLLFALLGAIVLVHERSREDSR